MPNAARGAERGQLALSEIRIETRPLPPVLEGQHHLGEGVAFAVSSLRRTQRWSIFSAKKLREPPKQVIRHVDLDARGPTLLHLPRGRARWSSRRTPELFALAGRDMKGP